LKNASLNYALSPDGRTLLAGVSGVSGHSQDMVLADTATGKTLLPLEGVQDVSSHPAFSPDGRTVAGDQRGVVSLWEVASGRSRGRLPEPRRATALAFSPDGRFLAIGADPYFSEPVSPPARGPRAQASPPAAAPDVPVTLWDLTAGEVVGRLRGGFGGRVEHLVFSPDGSRLAVSGYSPAALVCDLTALCGGRFEAVTKTGEPTAEELEGLWAEVAGADSARAYRAIRRLGGSGARAAAFLKKQLHGGPAGPDEHRIARLIADLNHDDFAVREKASAELEAIGRRAKPALQRALAGKVSVEARNRLKRLLDRLGSPEAQPPPPELVRRRAVEALEANGTPEARKVLAELAVGLPDSPLAGEAKASLQRLAKRTAAKP
jgi:hypothetical protein